MIHAVERLQIGPCAAAVGLVTLPGSKSISNRTLLLAALSVGETVVRNLLKSDDTAVMLAALNALGVKVESLGTGDYRVWGCGGNFPNHEATLFLGNAGTAFRPLTAALALQSGPRAYILDGVPRMRERPIQDLVDGLAQLGAAIAYASNKGFPPLTVGSRASVAADRITVRGDVSSQFLSALLMALPLLQQTVVVDVVGELISKPYVEITLNLMARFGVTVARDGWQRFIVSGDSHYIAPTELSVEGDASSASYFLAAGAIAGGPVRVIGVGRSSIQGDVKFAESLAAMGAVVTMGDDWIEAAPPTRGRLRGIDADFNHIPDAAMTIAMLALFAEGPTTIRNIASWRVKETDRIAAMATELRKVGAAVEEGPDYLKIVPPAEHLIPHAQIDTYDDHRMAMCFSLVALGGVAVTINDPNCVAKTFPDYFHVYGGLVSADASSQIARPDVPVVAIDGPTASGKGTVAQHVASRLGFHYLDSGSLYRLAALAAHRQGVDLTDENAVAAVASMLDIRFDGERVYLAGDDVSEAIRTESASQNASRVAALPAVRAALTERQRAFRQAPGLVADGRDIGSVIFPDADVKVFLTASVEARAERRTNQLKQKGISAILVDVVKELRIRDERDSSRQVAPLKRLDDAYLLDTTAISADEAVRQVLELVEREIGLPIDAA